MNGPLFAASVRRRLDAVVVVACVVFALWVTFLQGPDLNWDLQNYHLYSAFSFVKGRLHSEFMAAGMMSYLNPLPMLPFYGMVAAGWHSVLIGTLLALAHAVNLVLLWMICRRLFGKMDRALTLALLAMIIGAASPLFIAEIGTSYADISTCAPVLGGVLLLLGAQTRGRLLAAGALLGAAAGLKLTNMPFAVAAAVFLFAPGTSWRERGANLCWFALGGLIGAVLTGGYWALLLYTEFHNPVFPFANSIFRSPDFPALSHIHRRFLPGSVLEALTLPFYLALPKDMIYVEITAPDFRFAFCILAGAAALIMSLRRQGARPGAVEPTAAVLPRFIGYIMLCWTLWLLQFSNGRYFLPLTLLIGPALVLLLTGFLAARRAVLLAFLIAFLQLAQLYVVGVQRFGETDTWNDRFIAFNMPDKLVQRPYLYLSLDMQSQSYVAPFVHPQSRFLNVDGMMPLDVVGPGGERVRQQIERFKGATRMLVAINTAPAKALVLPKYVRALDADLNRFGLRMDTRDCVGIDNPALIGSTIVVGGGVGAGQTTSGRAKGYVTLLSCALVPAPTDLAVQSARAEAAKLIDKIEQACPRQFPTRWNGVVMRSKDGVFWSRFYVDTDLFVNVGAKNVYVQSYNLPTQILGTPAGLMNGTERVPCERIRSRAAPALSLDPQ